ncbi:LapA family protein [Fructilactobacillus florum]|uniref:Lipopolysaccharide assembly protein A domain-containing protein n=1 Tax=Fructilactobacillus florum DSM 22689 = JCM 16035 TaxID=1423745 RepID=A0A0R2CJD6_9LACO|nr:LapA family protein [Fructilactobacillus florum]KRM91697.1 hypothetical protein FC87_GL000834 [Fructilactobacillus florum DSM 22689 = JCM 16035]
MKKQVAVICGIIIVFLLAIFVLLNMEDTAINFGFATVKMPLILVVLTNLLIGALLVFLFSSVTSWKASRDSKSSQKEIEALKQEKADLLKQIESLSQTQKQARAKSPQESENKNK